MTLFVMWGLLFHRPLPTIDGHYRLLGLNERAEALRDVHGIPHVFAGDLYDLFFMQGYVTAQDRFMQMELLRIEAGRRSGGLARAAAERAAPGLRETLAAYADGVTKWLEQHAAAEAVPGELVLAGRRPAPWRPEDSLAIAAAWLERPLPASVCASVAAEGTAKGRPLLAADLYLDAPAPGWYEIGLDGGGMRAVGVSLPGVPGIAAGHNGWVAWAVLSSQRRASDPAASLGAIVDAMAQRSGGAFADAMRRSALASCVADVAGPIGVTDADLVMFVKSPAVLSAAGASAAGAGGDGGRGTALAKALGAARGVDIEAARVLLGRPPAGVSGVRLIVDLADADTSRSAISAGASAHRASAHFMDQAPLWEIGQVHRLALSRAALGPTDGVLVLRAR